DEIVLDEGLKDMNISELGLVTAKNEDDEIEEIATIKLVKFINPEGLEAIGKNLYKATNASGEEIPMEDETRTSTLRQGYLETSNVQIIDEMVRLISAQRAYEI